MLIVRGLEQRCYKVRLVWNASSDFRISRKCMREDFCRCSGMPISRTAGGVVRNKRKGEREAKSINFRDEQERHTRSTDQVHGLIGEDLRRWMACKPSPARHHRSSFSRLAHLSGVTLPCRSLLVLNQRAWFLANLAQMPLTFRLTAGPGQIDPHDFHACRRFAHT